jgi:hypothetical protein
MKLVGLLYSESLYGERLVAPVSLRRETIDGINFGHFGEVKCVRRAKSSIYWPGCDDNIRNIVANARLDKIVKSRIAFFPTRHPAYPFQMVSTEPF